MSDNKYIDVFVEKNVFLSEEQISNEGKSVSYEYEYPRRIADGWENVKVTEEATRQPSGAYTLYYGHGPNKTKELIVVSKPDSAGVVKAMAGSTIKITREAAKHFSQRPIEAVRVSL